ncbi:MAG: hypothetical protein L0287_05730 [Anaerolineae bacterium]|nr:hypothetical protein [Anaerolineae bacterium]MCI0611192.1 hypothetical protein [Anaerolineae bacterium]
MKTNLYIMLGIVILVVGAAAFIAGRMLNRGVSPLGLSIGPKPDGITILPAEELPKTEPEAEGLFIERQDNIIFVQGGGPGNENPRGVQVGSPEHLSGGPKFEVVVTTETILYHDTTEPPAHRPTGDDPRVLLQTVVEGTLDDLINLQSLVMVWGRKSGDRIIAEVLVYSTPAFLQQP